MLLFGLILSNPAHAADVFWEGMYRLRGQYFDTLSLSDSNSDAEGASNLLTHRLRLQPNWRISPKLSLHTQLDILPFESFGGSALFYPAPTQTIPLFPDSTQSSSALSVTRLWGEYRSQYGLLKMGRIPLHWGSGMVFNAGNGAWDEFGNSVDRVQFTAQVQNLYVLGGVESYAENQVNLNDDTWGLAGALYYAKSNTELGLYVNYRQQGPEETRMGMLTADLYGGIDSGDLRAELELAVHYGSGDINGGYDDISVLAFGAATKVGLALNKLELGVDAGFAQGDSTPNDQTINTFHFNRDYNLSLMMFEEPMPILRNEFVSEEGDERDLSAVRTGYSISNAIYLRPNISYNIRKNLRGSLTLLTAWTAALPEDEDDGFYGIEVDAHLAWTPTPNFTLESSIGLFNPGNYYSSYSDFGGGFDRYALGAQLMSTINF